MVNKAFCGTVDEEAAAALQLGMANSFPGDVFMPGRMNSSPMSSALNLSFLEW